MRWWKPSYSVTAERHMYGATIRVIYSTLWTLVLYSLRMDNHLNLPNQAA